MKYLVRWNEWTPDHFSARVHNQLAETIHDVDHPKVALYHRCCSIFGFERASKLNFSHPRILPDDSTGMWVVSEVIKKQEVPIGTFVVTKLEE